MRSKSACGRASAGQGGRYTVRQAIRSGWTELKIIREGKGAGLSVRKIAAKVGLSVGTVHSAQA